MNPIFHLFLTEIRRNAWIIAAYLLAVLFSAFSPLVLLLGGVLAFRLGQENNLTRSTSHWKVRPISGWDWAVSCALFLLVICILPVAIKQGALIYSIGLSPAVALRTALETGLLAAAMAVPVWMIASISPGPGKCLGLMFGLVVWMGIVSFMGEAISFSPATPSGEWFTEMSKVPRVFPWWLATIVIPLSIAVLAGLLGHRTKEGKRSREILVAGVALFGIALLWAEQNFFRYELGPAYESLSLHWDKSEDKSEATGDGQTIFPGLSITRLPMGNYANLRFLQAKGSKWHRPSSYSTATLARSTILRLFPDQLNLFVSSGYYQRAFDSGAISDTKSMEEYFSDPAISEVRVGGEVFQWREVGTIPFSEGTYRLKDGNRSLQIKTIENQAEGRKRFHFLMNAPRLRSTKRLEWSALRGRWRGADTVLLVAEHGELGETVLLAGRRRGNWEGYRNEDFLGRYESWGGSFELTPDPRWRILWPDESDTLSKWLAGAKLKVYAPEFLGRWDEWIEG